MLTGVRVALTALSARRTLNKCTNAMAAIKFEGSRNEVD